MLNYIEEMKKTLKRQETELWGELLETGKSMEYAYPEMQLNFQQIKEIKDLNGIKTYISRGGRVPKKRVKVLVEGLMLQTKTLSN